MKELIKEQIYKLKIKNFILEAIKSKHWVKDSYPERIIQSTFSDLDEKHKTEVNNRLKFIEGIEFSDNPPQKLGVWVYEAPEMIKHPPFKERDKGKYLLAIINDNTMTTLYWKHIKEGQFDYSISFDDLVAFVKTDYYNPKTKPLSITNLKKWKNSLHTDNKPKLDKFKKLKLDNGQTIKYYHMIGKFETMGGEEIKVDTIFDELPTEVQDEVIELI